MDESTFTNREKEVHDHAFRKGVRSISDAIEILHDMAENQSMLNIEYARSFTIFQGILVKAERFAERVERTAQSCIEGTGLKAETLLMDCKELAVEFLTFLKMKEFECQATAEKLSRTG